MKNITKHLLLALVLFTFITRANAQDELFMETDTGTVWWEQYLVNLDIAYQSTGDHEISFDGSDDDWSDYPAYELTIADLAEGKTVPDASDFTVKYKAAWDDVYLYMLFDVTDDVISTNHPDDKSWHKDGIEITTFMVSDTIRRISDGSWGLGLWGVSPNWAQKVLISYDMVTAQDAIGEGFNHYDSEENELRPIFDFDFIKSDKDNGYIIEVMMSWDFLNGYSPEDDLGKYAAEPFVPKENEMFTIWLAANDNDTPEGGNKEHTLLHQPAELKWHTPEGNNSFLKLAGEYSTAIHEIMPADISVYPNPVSDFVNIETKTQIKSIKVFDITGKEISQKNFVNQKKVSLNTKKFKKGIYIIEITDENQNKGVVKIAK